MKPPPALLVADVGNSRMKWGWQDAQGLTQGLALPLDDVQAWAQAIAPLPHHVPWLLAGSNPPVRDALADWLREQGRPCRVVRDYRLLPIPVGVRQPERVGLDRLLNAVAVVRRQQSPSLIVDAGSAVTVDLVDGAGTFQGGAILPGLRLMARCLKQGTANLPEVPLSLDPPPFPGRVTEEAIALGLAAALIGGIETLVRQAQATQPRLHLLLTGGDAPRLQPLLADEFHLEPWLTLEGLLWTARTLPT